MRQHRLEYMNKCRDDLKRESKTVGISMVTLFCITVLFVCFRNPSSHMPSVAGLSIIWTFGIWFLMLKIFVKILPLKRDISFSQTMLDSKKKEYDGIVMDCKEEITMHRMPCWILKLEVEDRGKKVIRQVYLDQRFLFPELERGSRIKVLVAQHFVFAFDNGGIADE